MNSIFSSLARAFITDSLLQLLCWLLNARQYWENISTPFVCLSHKSLKRVRESAWSAKKTAKENEAEEESDISRLRDTDIPIACRREVRGKKFHFWDYVLLLPLLNIRFFSGMPSRIPRIKHQERKLLRYLFCCLDFSERLRTKGANSSELATMKTARESS